MRLFLQNKGCFGATVALGHFLRKLTPVILKENSKEMPPKHSGMFVGPSAWSL